MESNWRMNVALAGMVLSDWRLCARSLEDPDLALVSRMGSGIQQSSVWFWPLPEDFPIQLTPWTNQLGHFPFGEAVEPDGI